MSSATEATISKTVLFEKLGYTPHSPEQWDFHNSNARFKVPCCGRRWGKSTASAREMEAALFVPDAYYWIVGPNYGLGEKEFRIIYRDLITKLGLKDKIKATYNLKQGDMTIRMPWNTVLEVKSAERKDSLVGEGLHGVLMSEAAIHSRDTWEMFIQPALADNLGFAIFPSTPRGYNWYQGAWQLGQEPSMIDYQSWRFPSWTNPVVYPGGRMDPEIIRYENVVSKAFFKQEIAAEFTAFEGQIYDEFDRELHVTDIEYNPAWRNYIAFDFGFTNQFVALDIMVDPSDNVYVWREYVNTNVTTHEHGLIIKNRQNPQGYHVDCMYGDPRGADEIATLSMILGPVWGRDVPWLTGIEYVKRWLKVNPLTQKPRLYFDRSCTNTVRQVEQLRKADEKEGKESKEGQHKYDDHGADALRYFFNEFFVLGGNVHLNDIYGSGYTQTEAEGFFRQNMGITNNEGMRF